MDDERLKEGRNLGADYFDELLERIRDIRASEKRFYRKITDIYALSVDYDPHAPVTHEFFASVQNRLHWAIHADTCLMGLYTQENQPELDPEAHFWHDGHVPGAGVRCDWRERRGTDHGGAADHEMKPLAWAQTQLGG